MNRRSFLRFLPGVGAAAVAMPALKGAKEVKAASGGGQTWTRPQTFCHAVSVTIGEGGPGPAAFSCGASDCALPPPPPGGYGGFSCHCGKYGAMGGGGSSMAGLG